MRMRSPALIAAMLSAAAPAAAGTECKATKQHYSALETGMSYAEAVAIVGCEGEEMSSSEMMGIRTIMVMWDGASFGSMTAMFQNDELMSKAQFGLK